MMFHIISTTWLLLNLAYGHGISDPTPRGLLMSKNSRYMVVITGKPLPGHNISNVKNNVSLRFNIQDTRIDKMFSGRPVAIKKGLELEAAKKFKQAFVDIGAECMVLQDKKSPPESDQPTDPKNAPQPPPSAPAAPPPPTGDPVKEALKKRSREKFELLDARYQEVVSQSGFEKTNTMFAFLTIALLAAIGAAWAMTPVTWYMAVPAMVVVLLGLGVPLMGSQKVFLKKMMAACVDEQDTDLAFSLACMDTWLDALDDSRQAILIRKELDKVIGRHGDLMEKMMDHAYVLAEIAQEEQEKNLEKMVPLPPEDASPTEPSEEQPEE